MNPLPDKNPSSNWAAIFVDALTQSGLESICVSPGSRSTPLTLAFHTHPDINVYRHLDERSAGFFALGLGMATGKAAALLCTSGTAAANYMPAVVEARMSGVPLLVLTADRPPELRHSGANQTINQVNLYGDQVLWSIDAPLPEAAAPESATRNLIALASRASATANGLCGGPVHVNFPFRKPLEPSGAIVFPNSRVPVIQSGTLSPSQDMVHTLANVINDHPRGLIVCGPKRPDEAFESAIRNLSQRSGYSVMADPLSNLRFGGSGETIGGYETFLARGVAPPWHGPTVILRFGALPTSKWLNHYLSQIDPAYRFHIRSNGVWADDSHLTTHFWQVDETALCRKVTAEIGRDPEREWAKQIRQREDACWQIIGEQLAASDFDGAYMADLLSLLPDDCGLFLGNSLPVRHADQFGRPSRRHIHLYGNRGASGIDGNLSTALGIATATSRTTVAVVGDITFFHDANALEAASQSDASFTIVLLNNNGGGIFQRLPIKDLDPPFTSLFLTPHQIDFGSLAAAHGINYAQAGDRAEFTAHVRESLGQPGTRVIEVQTNSQRDEAIRQQIIESVLDL